MDAILQAGALLSFLAGVINGLGRDGASCGVGASTRKQPLGGLALQATPVVAQGFQQRGAEHDISVLATFPAPDMDDHASAVDIGDLQASQLGASCPCAIERHQYNALKPRLGRVDEAGNFFSAQYAVEVLRLLLIRFICPPPSFLHLLYEEEPGARQRLRDGASRDAPLSAYIRLILP